MGLIAKIIDRHRHMKATCTKIVNSNGVIYTWSDGRPQQAFKWSEVSEIRTYKVDCFAYDDICLRFRIGDNWYEVSEQDDIFRSVVETVEQIFPGIPTNWYSEVMLPAFDTNDRLLWPAG
ncbi:MAG: hypothetical protein AAF711_00815 [Planctomycetota bacterium]